MIDTARTRVRHVASWLKRRAIEAIDRRYGVSTSDFVYLDDLSLPIENRVWHDPSDWFALRRALRRLRVGPDDVFVDYGSGLGRAVLIAATFPFRRVMGVELASEMTQIARANVQRNHTRLRASAVEFVVSDATAWEIPPDVTVAYFYCPFTGDIFERVIANLLASVDRHPRPLRLVYNYPVEHSYLIRTGRVEVLDVVSNQPLPRSRKTGEVIVTYLVLPSDPVLQREYRARFPRRVRDHEWLGEYEPGFVLEKPARLGGVFLRRPKLSV